MIWAWTGNGPPQQSVRGAIAVSCSPRCIAVPARVFLSLWRARPEAGQIARLARDAKRSRVSR